MDASSRWKQSLLAKYFIYALCDPRNGAVRYIGSTKDVRKRLQSHLRKPLRSLKAWLEELRAVGLTPSVSVLAEADGRFSAFDLETETIARYAALYGEQILNVHYRVSRELLWEQRDAERLEKRRARREAFAMRRNARAILSPKKSARTAPRIIEHDGQRLSLSGWAKRLGLSRERVRQRVNKYPVEIALNPPGQC